MVLAGVEPNFRSHNLSCGPFTEGGAQGGQVRMTGRTVRSPGHVKDKRDGFYDKGIYGCTTCGSGGESKDEFTDRGLFGRCS